MGQIELSCPGCSKRLRLSDEHVGKTVRCPSCKTTFPVAIEQPPANERPAQSPEVKSRSTVRIVGRPAPESPVPKPPSGKQPSGKSPKKAAARPSRATRKPAAPVREEADSWQDGTEDLWSYSDDQSEDYEDPYSETRPASARSRRKKSDLPGRLLKGGLIFLLVLVALGSVGGIGYFAWTRLPRISGNVADMTWFPENLEGFAQIKLSSILSSPIVKAIEAKNSPFPNEGPLGLKNSDINSMVIGYWKDADARNEIPSALMMSPWGLQSGPKGVMIVARLNRAVSASEITMKIQSEYKGMRLYDGGNNKVCWMPDSATVVMGDEKHVREAIDRGDQEFRFTQFDFAGSSGDIVFATTGEAATFANSPLGASSFGAGQALSTTLARVTRGGSVSLWFSERIQIRAELLCTDEPGAAQIVKDINESVSLGKSQIEKLKVNPAFQKFAGPLTETLNSIVATQGGSTVTMNAEIGQSLIDQLPTGGF